MNMLLKKAPLVLSLLGLTLAGCQPDIDEPKADRGTADFTRYIAVGNSLTAGYADGGLYLEGQQNSYPSILAGQFKAAGGGDFVQPLFNQPNQQNGTGYLRLAGFTAAGLPVTANVTTNLAVRGLSPSGGALYTRYDNAINNLGVPGIRMSDIETAGYGSVQGNAYFERITPTATPTQTYLARVAASTPTFFTNWLGNNDVLLYATAGAAANTMTDVATFTDKNNKLIDALTANGAKGLVASIPNVTTVPFFNTVGPSLKATLTAGSVPGLVITTGALAPGQANTRRSITTADIRGADGVGRQLLTLTASPYAALIGRPTGKYWRDFYQQARPSLPATVPNLTVFLLAMQVDTTQLFGLSTGNPFPSTLVLDDTEQTAVVTRTNELNQALRTKATAKGLSFFDVNTFFTNVAGSGYATNGVTNTAAFISGNLFSLDGVHLTPRGYSIIANEMIKVINSTYGSTIQTVNPDAYRAVQYP